MGIAPAGPASSNLITIPNPVAGANWQYIVPANTSLEIISIYFSITCDANAGNRYLMVTFDDGGVQFHESVQLQKVVASASQFAIFGAGLTTIAASPITRSTAALPIGLLLQPTWRINSSVFDKQAGDQLSGIRILTRRYVS